MANLPPNHNEFAPAARQAHQDNSETDWVDREDHQKRRRRKIRKNESGNGRRSRKRWKMRMLMNEWDRPRVITPISKGSHHLLPLLVITPKDPTSGGHVRSIWKHLSQGSDRLQNELTIRAAICSTGGPMAQLFMRILGSVYFPQEMKPLLLLTDNDDSPTHKETSPSEPQGSPPRDSS
ncbi:hypothetical protein Tco_0340711 [Tanacetum coccineum]